MFHADYVSGGSSSGSAVAVAAGLVPFALGTDTAGSGRVPAAFNNIVGIKPTPGRTTGVVPACWSLDCVSILSASVTDGVRIRRIAEGFDASDPYSVQGMKKTLPSCTHGRTLFFFSGSGAALGVLDLRAGIITLAKNRRFSSRFGSATSALSSSSRAFCRT